MASFMSGFGVFKLKLAGLLTKEIIEGMAVLLEFPRSKIDELKKAEASASHMMVTCLEERGIISKNDICKLVVALEKLDLFGVAEELKQSYKENVSHQLERIVDEKHHYLACFLKTSYQIQYKTIQPVPLKDYRYYSIEEVYVESKIEIMGSRNNKDENEHDTTWLSSYKDLFNPDVVNSNRIVIESAPGFGKTTLALKIAHDWCTSQDSSPFQKDDILLLLSLRNVLGSISIVQAIKKQLLPSECSLSDEKVMSILEKCRCLIIILDNYEAYFGRNDKSTQVQEILIGKMFANAKVILLTQPGVLPSDLAPDTMLLRLGSFDANVRQRYIQQIASREEAGTDNYKRLSSLQDIFNKNIILADMCQDPMICAMVVHLTKDNEFESTNTMSLTGLIKHIIDCLYRQVSKSSKSERKNPEDHSKLNELVFKELCEDKKEQLLFEKETLIQMAGESLVGELIEVGILVQSEKPVDGSNEKGETVLRFYHPIFAGWYAAHYLAYWLSGRLNRWVSYYIQMADPFRFELVYRFVCGINHQSSDRIVTHLKSITGGRQLETLCLLERTENLDQLFNNITRLCRPLYKIRKRDAQLVRQSKIKFLQFASDAEIPITCLRIMDNFQKVNKVGDKIVLRSGESIPPLTSLKSLEIWKVEGIMTEEDFMSVFKYSARCPQLESIKFTYCKKLVHTFTHFSDMSLLKDRKIKVSWTPDSETDELSYELDLDSGCWLINSSG